jgi:hypothetical protein
VNEGGSSQINMTFVIKPKTHQKKSSLNLWKEKKLMGEDRLVTYV